MRQFSLFAAAGAVLMLAGCDSGEAPKKEPEAATAKALVPGEYSYTSEVTKLASTDKTTPATTLKLGDKAEGKTCIGAEGTLDTALFAEEGDNCAATGTYVRSGRISNQYKCERSGKGSLYPNIDGNFTADGFEFLANSSSRFPGDGDYELTRHIVAKRTGDCTAAPAQG